MPTNCVLCNAHSIWFVGVGFEYRRRLSRKYTQIMCYLTRSFVLAVVTHQGRNNNVQKQVPQIAESTARSAA